MKQRPHDHTTRTSFVLNSIRARHRTLEPSSSCTRQWGMRKASSPPAHWPRPSRVPSTKSLSQSQSRKPGEQHQQHRRALLLAARGHQASLGGRLPHRLVSSSRILPKAFFFSRFSSAQTACQRPVSSCLEFKCQAIFEYFGTLFARQRFSPGRTVQVNYLELLEPERSWKHFHPADSTLQQSLCSRYRFGQQTWRKSTRQASMSMHFALRWHLL